MERLINWKKCASSEQAEKIPVRREHQSFAGLLLYREATEYF